MPKSRRPWRLPGIPIALALFALTACSGTAPEPRPTTSTIAPILENEEQALAAVADTYERFIELSNAITADKGAGAERILEVASPDVAATEMQGFATLAESSFQYLGAARSDGIRVQTWSAVPDGNGVLVSALVCLDVSEVDVLDSSGISVVPAERVTRLPYAIDLGPGSPAAFLITNKTLREGSSICEAA